MDGTLILTIIGTVATIIGTIATIISTVLAVKAKNESKEIFKQIQGNHSRNLKDNGHINLSNEGILEIYTMKDKLNNSGNNDGVMVGNNSGTIDGQYIIPILRERIDKIDQQYIEKAKILELSSNNKFFRILKTAPVLAHRDGL